MSDFNDPGNPNNQFFNGGNGEPFQANRQQFQQNPYQQNPYQPYQYDGQQHDGQQYSQPYGQQAGYRQAQPQAQPQQNQPQAQPQQNQQQPYDWQQTANGQPQYAQYPQYQQPDQQPNQQSNQTAYGQTYGQQPGQQAYDQYAYRQMPNPQPAPQVVYAPEQKSKLAAGLLGIFLGSLGVHNFYLGNTGKAVAQLLLTVLGCLVFIGPAIAGIWGLVEGILILCSSYGSSWHKDGNGNELRD